MGFDGAGGWSLVSLGRPEAVVLLGVDDAQVVPTDDSLKANRELFVQVTLGQVGQADLGEDAENHHDDHGTHPSSASSLMLTPVWSLLKSCQLSPPL